MKKKSKKFKCIVVFSSSRGLTKLVGWSENRAKSEFSALFLTPREAAFHLALQKLSRKRKIRAQADSFLPPLRSHLAFLKKAQMGKRSEGGVCVHYGNFVMVRGKESGVVGGRWSSGRRPTGQYSQIINLTATTSQRGDFAAQIIVANLTAAEPKKHVQSQALEQH